MIGDDDEAYAAEIAFSWAVAGYVAAILVGLIAVCTALVWLGDFMGWAAG